MIVQPAVKLSVPMPGLRGLCLIVAASIYLLGTLPPSTLFAQRPQVPIGTLGVDEVTPTNGKKMYGVIMNKGRRGVTMIVERRWFEATYANLYKKHVAIEQKSIELAQQQTLARLDEWAKSRPDDQELLEFIAEEKARLSQEHSAEDPKAFLKKPFTVVSFQPNEVRDTYIQPPQRRQIVGVAWKYQLDRVNTRTVASLERELFKRKIDVQNEAVNLSDQFAAAKLQGEREWNARVALFEYVLRKPLDFQGSGTNLIKIDKNKPVNPNELMQAMLGGGGMGGGLGLGGLGALGVENASLIQELLNEINGGSTPAPRQNNEWWKSTAAQAEVEGFRGLRITRMIPSAGSNVQVETIFLARIQPGKWEQVVSFTANENRDRQPTEDLARLQADPQIASIMKTMQGLGLGNSNLMETALKQGAATEKAMQKSAEQFFSFLDEFTVSTDKPAWFQN